MTRLGPILLISILLSSANAAALSLEPGCNLQNVTIEVTPELECLTITLGESVFSCGGGNGPMMILENDCTADVLLTYDEECEGSKCWAPEYHVPAGESTVIAIPGSPYEYGGEGVHESWSLGLTIEENTYGLKLIYTVTSRGIPDSETGGCQQFGAESSLSLLFCLFGFLWLERRYKYQTKK